MNVLPRIALAAVAALGVLALATIATPARADGSKAVLRVAPLPAWQQECAACHVAYPPALLPRASWQRLMADLPRHFGTDASLDPGTVHQIAAFLEANAADVQRARAVAAPPEDRITRSAWFGREHDEVPAATWQRASIRSPAHCAACHPRASQGVFDEHDVRIPR